MTKERPILFSTEMVKAILQGRKTQTRRTKGITTIEGVNGMKTMTFPPVNGKYAGTHTYVDAEFTTFGVKVGSGLIECPYGALGDVLWVRETWAPFVRGDGKDGTIELIKFKADGAELSFAFDKDYYELGWHCRPSIHMPKAAARIWLEITDIKVERLESVTEEDAIAEGIEPSDECTGKRRAWYRDYMQKNDWYFSPRASFLSLWTSINGRDSRAANPWVWVISFKVLSTTGRPAELEKEVAHV
jgi:hypothetical protein